jgi:hypothetical protein
VRRILLLTLLFAMCFTTLGCGSRERGKHSDFDRPAGTQKK